MIGCWPDSKTPLPSALWRKAAWSCRGRRWSVRKVERRGGCRVGDLDLHDGPGVRAVAGQDARGGVRELVRSAGVVVVGRDAGRERGGRVVVEDQRLAGELAEVDDHVGPLGRGQQERELVHEADVEPRRVGDPGGGLLAVLDDRGRQEAALGADHDPVRSGATRGRGREDDRVGLGGCDLCLVEGDLGRADQLAGSVQVSAGRGVLADVPLEVEEAVVGRVQDAEPVRLGIEGERRVGDAVDDRRVVELLHADRDVRRTGDLLGLAERVGVVLPGGRVVEVAGNEELG